MTMDGEKRQFASKNGSIIDIEQIEKLEHEATLRGDGCIALVHAICRDIALANEQAIVEAEFGRLIRLIEDQKNSLG